MSRRVSQSFTLSFAELKFILSIFCETLRFISEPLLENKKNFLVNPLGKSLKYRALAQHLSWIDTFQSGLNVDASNSRIMSLDVLL